MTTKFITLTMTDGAKIYINPITISAVSPSLNPKKTATYVYIFGAFDPLRVEESVEEVMKLIQATDPMNIIHYDPKKP